MLRQENRGCCTQVSTPYSAAPAYPKIPIMLSALSIRDFVLIERLDLEFDSGFTALTGETGAGKSIVLDALGLTCGAKADVAQVRTGAARAEITAEFSFDPKSSTAKVLAESASDDGSGRVLLRRVVEAEGRSRAFINGRPAAIAELRALGETLVDVHAQHEHQSLTKPTVQREWLDQCCAAGTAREAVAHAWQAQQTARRAYERATQEADQLARERDELDDRAKVLHALAPNASEWAQLGVEQTKLANAQTLMDAASAAVNAVADQDDALTESLATIISKLRAAERYDASLKAHADLLDSAAISLDEAAHGLRSYVEKFDLDPDRAKEVEARMSALHQTARRFRVPVEQLEGLLTQTQLRLAELAESADLDALERKLAQSKQALAAACDELTRLRTAGAKKLAKAVNAMIAELALGSARFEVQLLPLAEPGSTGAEDVSYRFASHPTLPVQPIEKAASGGELARLSLAIMVALAQADAIATLVFDEVDVGIGGGVAAIVGAHLRALAGTAKSGKKARQVFAVTHQAQVAAHANQHLAVRKLEAKNARGVRIDTLSEKERIEELARMIAGRETTAATRAHAKELLVAGQA
jgi:DNA repair protein RecN (Recombination protein N)